jgi:hypothetical protein
MSSFTRAYLSLVGAVLLVAVALVAYDARIESAVDPSNSTYTTAEQLIAVGLLVLASFALVLAFLPAFLQWYSTKALVVAVIATLLLTVVLIGIYRWLGIALI